MSAGPPPAAGCGSNPCQKRCQQRPLFYSGGSVARPAGIGQLLQGRTRRPGPPPRLCSGPSLGSARRGRHQILHLGLPQHLPCSGRWGRCAEQGCRRSALARRPAAEVVATLQGCGTRCTTPAQGAGATLGLEPRQQAIAEALKRGWGTSALRAGANAVKPDASPVLDCHRWGTSTNCSATRCGCAGRRAPGACKIDVIAAPAGHVVA